ncbi:hypothetical protein LWI29_015579 [Acer saccharum]|uniref:PB1-like domain-containing protein n=1 Tax=Acer saccharum TaxID=4024 RepID=A0AA39VNT8_ACESA|nr:hypothetical protein LWI29_015579 [Acer saccharum]
MVEARSSEDEQPQYSPDDIDNFFTFKVHHGGGFDGQTGKYNGVKISFINYVSIDELSLLGLDDIVVSLGYKLPVGYSIDLPEFGKPFNIVCDQDLLWFGDKILDNRVVDLYLYSIEPLQTDVDDEVDLNVEGGAQVDAEDNGHDVVGDRYDFVGHRPTWVNEECYVELLREDAERANYPNKDWDSLEFRDVPRVECGSGLDIDDGSNDLNNLDGSNGEDDEGRHPRNFLNTRYHQFNPDRDMQHPIFRVGMVFGSADMFR